MTLPNITNKQQEILKYLYHFRFLNRIQIQALLKHKDYKSIYLWLKDLTEKEYINRIYSTAFPDNTKPAVYYIGPNGIKFLRVNTDCPKEQINKLWREKDRQQTFISDCQFLADIYIDLRNKSTDEIKYSVKTKTTFLDKDSLYNFLAETSVNLVIEKTKGSMKKYYLLEILDDNLPGYSVKKRVQNYIDMYYSNSWEENTSEDFPTIILVSETLPMMMTVKRLTKKLLNEYEGIEIKILFGFKSEMQKYGIMSVTPEEI